MPRHKRNSLTDLEISRLIAAGGPTAVTDGAGLTLTISAGGYAAWVLRYRLDGKRREYTIGPQADYPLERARKVAEELRARVTGGEDISTTRRQQKVLNSSPATAGSFAALADTWFRRTQEDRLKHPQVIWRVFINWINPRLGQLPVDKIQSFHVLDCLEDIKAGGAPTVANDARRYIRKVLDYGVTLGLIPSNPAATLSVRDAGVAENGRDRALSLEEVDTLLRAMADYRDRFGRSNELAIRLLLLLGVRKQELTQARWSELALSAPRWQLPVRGNKTGRGLIIPLPTLAVEHLKELQELSGGSEWVLSSRRRSRHKPGHIGPDTLNSALQKLPHGIDNFVIQDLRRTLRLHLSALGVRPEVTERCLNNKLRGVLGVFDQQDFLQERRAALARWASVIEKLDAEGLEAAREAYRLGAVMEFRSAVERSGLRL